MGARLRNTVKSLIEALMKMGVLDETVVYGVGSRDDQIVELPIVHVSSIDLILTKRILGFSIAKYQVWARNTLAQMAEIRIPRKRDYA